MEQTNQVIPFKINMSSWRFENKQIPTRMDIDLRGIDLQPMHGPICDDNLETRNTWQWIVK